MNFGSVIGGVIFTVCTGLFVCSSLYGQSHPDLGSLDDYPKGSKVWLASLVGDVIVDPEFPVVSSVLGKLEWKVESGEEVKEGQVICLSNVEKIDLSARKLALLKSRYANSLKDLEFSSRDEKKSLEAAKVELETRFGSLKITPTERELLGEDFEKRLDVERSKLNEEIEIITDKLNSEYFEQELTDNREALNLEVDSEEQSHKGLIRDSKLRAETDGKLKIELQEVVQLESEIGIIVKNKRGEVRLDVSGPLLGNIPVHEMGLELQGEDGKIYRGVYDRTIAEELFERGAPVIIFTLQKQEGSEAVPKKLAGKRMCRIYRILEEEGRIIPKEKLIFEYPDEINKSGWAAFIQKRWPSVELGYVGPRDLVVRPKDEN